MGGGRFPAQTPALAAGGARRSGSLCPVDSTGQHMAGADTRRQAAQQPALAFGLGWRAEVVGADCRQPAKARRLSPQGAHGPQLAGAPVSAAAPRATARPTGSPPPMSLFSWRLCLRQAGVGVFPRGPAPRPCLRPSPPAHTVVRHAGRRERAARRSPEEEGATPRQARRGRVRRGGEDSQATTTRSWAFWRRLRPAPLAYSHFDPCKTITRRC